MPGRMEFEFDLAGRRKARQADDSKPMRLLLIGDFSGSVVAERPPFASRPTHKVDVDTLDAVMKRLGPRLETKSGEIAFNAIDDFHPDSLFARVELFRALRQARTQPPAWSSSKTTWRPCSSSRPRRARVGARRPCIATASTATTSRASDGFHPGCGTGRSTRP